MQDLTKSEMVVICGPPKVGRELYVELAEANGDFDFVYNSPELWSDLSYRESIEYVMEVLFETPLESKVLWNGFPFPDLWMWERCDIGLMENLLIDRVTTLFNAEFYFIQPESWAQYNKSEFLDGRNAKKARIRLFEVDYLKKIKLKSEAQLREYLGGSRYDFF